MADAVWVFGAFLSLVAPIWLIFGVGFRATVLFVLHRPQGRVLCQKIRVLSLPARNASERRPRRSWISLSQYVRARTRARTDTVAPYLSVARSFFVFDLGNTITPYFSKPTKISFNLRQNARLATMPKTRRRLWCQPANGHLAASNLCPRTWTSNSFVAPPKWGV